MSIGNKYIRIEGYKPSLYPFLLEKNMKTNCDVGNFEEVMQRNNEITDYSDNGQCSNCGACCNDIIPLTNADINRIKKYIKENNIKPHTHAVLRINVIDTVCPFRDDNKGLCTIYPVRPSVCKSFSCHNYYQEITPRYGHLYRKTKNMSCREVFFGERK